MWYIGMRSAMSDNSAQRHRGDGAVARDLVPPASGLEFLTALREGVRPPAPFAGVSEIWLAEVEAGRVVFEALPSARFYNPLGTVHGGWISTLLDSAMDCAVHSTLQADQGYTTTDLQVRFHRPVLAET